MISGAEILGGKYTCTGGSTEEAKVKNKEQIIIDNGNTGNLLRCQLTDHQVIHEGYQIGNGILQDHGQCDGQYPFIK
jgi:hypothetical protein